MSTEQLEARAREVLCDPRGVSQRACDLAIELACLMTAEDGAVALLREFQTSGHLWHIAQRHAGPYVECSHVYCDEANKCRLVLARYHAALARDAQAAQEEGADADPAP